MLFGLITGQMDANDGKRSTIGTITKVELNNFFIENYKVEGIKTVQRMP